MQTSESVVVPVPPADVFPHVARLEAYRAWMPLVHGVESVEGASEPTWFVELRARVGPFARSKRLRMRRSALEPERLAVFERAEVDGRHHAPWVLRAELEPIEDDRTLVTMHLTYDGGLWSAGLLERVLEEEVRRGRTGLVALVSGPPTR